MRILALIIFMITSYAYGEVIPVKPLESWTITCRIFEV